MLTLELRRVSHASAFVSTKHLNSTYFRSLSQPSPNSITQLFAKSCRQKIDGSVTSVRLNLFTEILTHHFFSISGLATRIFTSPSNASTNSKPQALISPKVAFTYSMGAALDVVQVLQVVLQNIDDGQVLQQEVVQPHV